MSRGPHLPQYYADDKDVFDLLRSKQRRFDTESLLKLARRRGIYLSAETDAESLADYLSRLVWSWPELSHLLELADPPERRERFTSSRFGGEAPLEQVRTAVEAVKVNREKRGDEAFTVKAATPNKLTVAVRFSEPDFSRMRLQQRITRDVTLEFEKGESGYTLRHQASDRAKEIGKEILKQIQEVTPKTTAPSEITLRGIQSQELRTVFFLALMQDMPGMKLQNVTSVSVVRTSPTETEEEEEEPGGEPEGEDEGGVTETATEEAAAMLGVVKKAVFDGESLLDSSEFRRLRTEGFFLNRAVWRCREAAKTNGPDIEFEAGFEDSQHCEGFHYDVRGIYERRTRGEEGLKKARSPVPPESRLGLLQALEESAQVAIRSVVEKAQNVGGGPVGEGDLDVEP